MESEILNKFDWMIDYFRISGRITRRTYILRVLGRWAVSIVILLLFLIVGTIMDYVLLQFPNGIISFVLYVFEFVYVALLLSLLILYFVVTIAQEIKRLHDLNHSGWWSLARMIPLVYIIYFLWLLFIDGTVGQNRYGTDPKRRDSGSFLNLKK